MILDSDSSQSSHTPSSLRIIERLRSSSIFVAAASMRQMAKLHLTLLSLWVSARATLPHSCRQHYRQLVCGSAALVKTHSKIRVRCR